jgi:hypothetical protein
MGQDRPPPDWHSLDERGLERIYAGDDEEPQGPRWSNCAGGMTTNSMTG